MHPDVMSDYSEIVKQKNDNSLKVLNSFIQDMKPLSDETKRFTSLQFSRKHYELQFVVKDQEEPNNKEKSKTIVFDIKLPSNLQTSFTNIEVRKKWQSFYDITMKQLFYKCGLLESPPQKEISSNFVGTVDDFFNLNSHQLSELQNKYLNEEIAFYKPSQFMDYKEKLKFQNTIKHKILTQFFETNHILYDNLSSPEIKYINERLNRTLNININKINIFSPGWKYMHILVSKQSTYQLLKNYTLSIPYYYVNSDLLKNLQVLLRQIETEINILKQNKHQLSQQTKSK
ncbi:hypothetical protein WA158_007934 [Blastocystis sp. Blastoise]